MDAVNILTPVGRMVQGSPFEEQTTDMKGKQLTNAQGQPRSEYFFAIAQAPRGTTKYFSLYPPSFYFSSQPTDHESSTNRASYQA